MPKFFRVVLVVLFFIEFSMTEIVRPTTPSKFVKYELTSKVLAFGRIAAFIQMSSTNVLARSIDFEKKIVGSLMNRVASDTATAYFPGIDQADIYYPNWFSGEWKACSIFNSINYPLGYEIIGGETVKDSIEKDLGSKVCYNVRFQPYNDVSVVSDRLENVKEIAKATMGKGAIADIGIEERNSPDLVSLALSPSAAKGLVYIVRLAVTDRQQARDGNTFVTLERSTQMIQSSGTSNSRALSKEIETLSIYQLLKSGDIVADQRTATFLSKDDPRFSLAYGRDPRITDTAVDMRYYSINFKK